MRYRTRTCHRFSDKSTLLFRLGPGDRMLEAPRNTEDEAQRTTGTHSTISVNANVKTIVVAGWLVVGGVVALLRVGK